MTRGAPSLSVVAWRESTEPVWRDSFALTRLYLICGSASQAEGRGFDSRFPLHLFGHLRTCGEFSMKGKRQPGRPPLRYSHRPREGSVAGKGGTAVIRNITRLAAACSVVLLVQPASSAELVKCSMNYELKGWSVFYKTSRGSGRITCSNGQTADVNIVTHGGGVTFGTTEVIDGKGSFSSVRDISDLYGTYAEADAHAGAGRSADARAMMKGNVNLSLSGTGQGINLGFAFGRFGIEPK